MPDITMCGADNCPLKTECYRYRCIPSKYAQSYFMETPYNFDTNECEHFAGIIKGDLLTEIEKE